MNDRVPSRLQSPTEIAVTRRGPIAGVVIEPSADGHHSTPGAWDHDPDAASWGHSIDAILASDGSATFVVIDAAQPENDEAYPTAGAALPDPGHEQKVRPLLVGNGAILAPVEE